jgi:glycosyltransferase involved in cell wall biosynthesis
MDSQFFNKTIELYRNRMVTGILSFDNISPTLKGFITNTQAFSQISSTWNGGIPLKDFVGQSKIEIQTSQDNLVQLITPSPVVPSKPPEVSPPEVQIPFLSTKRSALPPAIRKEVVTRKKAAFLVATNKRPEMLSLCLQSLRTNVIPEGWELEILVGGEIDDPGREVVQTKFGQGVRFIPCAGPTVTTKLNTLMGNTSAELIMLADDDDIQVPGRMVAAVRAYEQGADWSGSGTVRFMDWQTKKVMKWWGDSSKGLVGTTLSFRGSLLREVGGWPEKKRGKDGALMARLHTLHRALKFVDVTADLEQTICIQGHGDNIWGRPVLEKGVRGQKGHFKIEGEGVKISPKKNNNHDLNKRSDIGIVICCYNNPELVNKWVKALKVYKQSYEVLFSISGERLPVNMGDYPYLVSENKGIVWAKNRGLKYMADKGIDHIFLVEDDVLIGDESFYNKVVHTYNKTKIGHMNFGPIECGKWPWKFTGESLTLNGVTFKEYHWTNKKDLREVPDINKWVTPGTIAYIHGDTLKQVGGLNPLFLGRGYGHIDWTWRIYKQADYKLPSPTWLPEIDLSGIEYAQLPSRGFDLTGAKEQISINRQLLITTILNNKAYPDNSYLFLEIHPKNIPGISICTGLRNRGTCLVSFLNHLENSIRGLHIPIELVISDFNSDDIDVVAEIKKHNVPCKYICSSGKFSRTESLHQAALCATFNKLFFMDIDMVVTDAQFWKTLDLTVSDDNVYFPICYSLHKDRPVRVLGASRVNTPQANGWWRNTGFGMVGITTDDYYSLGGWDTRIKKWGGEDTDLHWYAGYNKMTIHRFQNSYLFHIWHPKYTNLDEPYTMRTTKWIAPIHRQESPPNPFCVPFPKEITLCP